MRNINEFYNLGVNVDDSALIADSSEHKSK